MTPAAVAFAQYVKNKTVTIIGAGISNTPLVEMFARYGCRSIQIRDKNPISADRLELFQKFGAQIVCGENYLEDLNSQLILRTPGMRPDRPELVKAREQGAVVTSETQLFLRFCPCKTFGVTGSDGKTTTTTLISKLLATTGRKVHLGGNIGRPLLPILDQIQPEDYVCLELSSFQLMDAQYSPDVSVITNISENHLDWHKDMQEYKQAKANIFLHQKPGGNLILNQDDPESTAYAKQYHGKIRYFSLKNPVEEGAWLAQDVLTYNQPGYSPVSLFCKNNIRIPGIYNVANYLAAICSVYQEVDPQSILAVAREFNGVEHRVEHVRTLGGVRYYNSSIDSSPARTIATLGAFEEKLTVICGGYDKNLDYTVLKPHFEKRVKAVYVTGQTAPKILSALEGADTPYTICRCDSLKDALEKAKSKALPGDVVILSPASASFDSFKNFEERGRYFKDLVNNL